MSNYEIVGLMSGTSLDGLDIVHAAFHQKDDNWTFEILHSESSPYTPELKSQLQNATLLKPVQLQILDIVFAKEMALRVNAFLDRHKIDRKKIDGIASHGHTVYHQPHNGFSLQIGCGASLAFETKLPVINDFRTNDILAGGQGAPLVPIGDQLLFAQDAEAFLNLGGFCNITFQNNNRDWVAFDIAPCNLPMNKLAELRGQAFDKDGAIAKSGKLDFFLLDLLNKLPYYQQTYPKSLGTEWLEETFYPMVKFTKNIENNLCTVAEHIAIQIAEVLENNGIKKVLVTGGGAYNTHLLDRIRHHSTTELLLPSKEIIEYKEALIFGFLGALYLAKVNGNVPSATGATRALRLGVLHDV